MTFPPLRLVIFDCDGVLIDSEPVSRRLLAAEATALGWPMTEAAAHRFTGMTWSAIKPMFEARLGRGLPADWVTVQQDRLVARLAAGVEPMPGARDLLMATAALGLPYRVASNSSHAEMAEKFRVTGLAPLLEGRIHSAGDVTRGKPAPDLFLSAAAAERVPPAACVVVEDSIPGIAAAHAAGMQVIAYAPDGLHRDLPRAPHAVVTRLQLLPELFRRAMAGQAMPGQAA